jgi:DedD protein
MTAEELQFKQRARRRLIGAVTLVTGLVVFLPMVLDNEPKPVSEDIAINIPSQDGNVAKGGAGIPRNIGVPEIAAPEIVTPKNVLAQPATPPAAAAKAEPAASQPELPKPAKSAPAADEMVKEVAKPKPAAPQHQEQAVVKPEKPAEPVKAAAPKEIKLAAPSASPQTAEKPKSSAKPAEAVAAAQGGFVVRLGAFSKLENAKQLKGKVAAMGIRNYSGVLKTAAGDKTRVRAGPYATRREAEMVRDRLKAVDVVGDVVPK